EVIDEHGLGEPQVRGDRLTSRLRPPRGTEEHSHGVPTTIVRANEDVEHVHCLCHVRQPPSPRRSVTVRVRDIRATDDDRTRTVPTRTRRSNAASATGMLRLFDMCEISTLRNQRPP